MSSRLRKYVESPYFFAAKTAPAEKTMTAPNAASASTAPTSTRSTPTSLGRMCGDPSSGRRIAARAFMSRARAASHSGQRRASGLGRGHAVTGGAAPPGAGRARASCARATLIRGPTAPPAASRSTASARNTCARWA